jgi:hypothetical protein
MPGAQHCHPAHSFAPTHLAGHTGNPVPQPSIRGDLPLQR